MRARLYVGQGLDFTGGEGSTLRGVMMDHARRRASPPAHGVVRCHLPGVDASEQDVRARRVSLAEEEAVHHAGQMIHALDARPHGGLGADEAEPSLPAGCRGQCPRHVRACPGHPARLWTGAREPRLLVAPHVLLDRDADRAEVEVVLLEAQDPPQEVDLHQVRLHARGAHQVLVQCVQSQAVRVVRLARQHAVHADVPAPTPPRENSRTDQS